MAPSKSLNHSYFLVKFVAESKIQFKIVSRSSVVSCNYSTLDETIFVKFPDMIHQCSFVSTSNSIPDLEYQIPGLKEEIGLTDSVDEDVKPDLNLVKIEEEMVLDEDVKINDKEEGARSVVNQMVEVKEGGEKETLRRSKRKITDEDAHAVDGGKTLRRSKRISRKLTIIDNFSSSNDEFDDDDDNISIDYNCDDEEDDEEYISFGPNGTSIKESIYSSIKWDSYKLATRGLMAAVFNKNILASHCLSGKKNHKYNYKTSTKRPQLDVKKVEDVISIVSQKCGNVNTSEIRNIMAHKCNDERRSLKMHIERTVKLTENL